MFRFIPFYRLLSATDISPFLIHHRLRGGPPPPAGGPVAALTAHRAVIHYRDRATLALWEGAKYMRKTSPAEQGFIV